MKINVEVDCTPEEARRFMGLPDLTAVHDHATRMMIEAMEKGPRPEFLEQLMRGWAPMGEAGMAAWRKMIEDAVKR